MREIKFRGKRVDNGEWVYGWVFGDKAKSIIEIDKEYPNEYGIEAYYTSVVIPETAGQYTGLHDKNGKEIWEGDIVNVEHDFYETYSRGDIESGSLEVWEEVVDSVGLLTTVVYEDSAFMVEEWYLGNFKEKEVEVVGNIYDSPELVKP